MRKTSVNRKPVAPYDKVNMKAFCQKFDELLDLLFKISKADRGGIDREIIMYSFINNERNLSILEDLGTLYQNSVEGEDQKFKELVTPEDPSGAQIAEYVSQLRTVVR